MNACRSVNRAFQKLPEHLAQLHSNVWTNRPVLNQLLQRHARVRPITPTDVSNAESTLLTCELHHGNQIKTDICNYSMIATSLFLRRQRRRNFPKKATQILNAYFEAHMDDPYPTDETKERLAKECGVTVAQVSNWFGNRRIRFKKSLNTKQQPAKTRRNARACQ
ncbi:Pre B-cell leukemia transcription factor 1 [Aphelenchoides fujianensis]|nr:Pre B-cell leukemia transcription factor 1 [Aphelenchoides fujianensis]